MSLMQISVGCAVSLTLFFVGNWLWVLRQPRGSLNRGTRFNTMQPLIFAEIMIAGAVALTVASSQPALDGWEAICVLVLMGLWFVLSSIYCGIQAAFTIRHKARSVTHG